VEQETLCWYAALLTSEVQQMHLSRTNSIWNAVANLQFDYRPYFHLSAESIYVWLQCVFPFKLTADCISKCLLQDVYKNVVRQTLFWIILVHQRRAFAQIFPKATPVVQFLFTRFILHYPRKFIVTVLWTWRRTRWQYGLGRRSEAVWWQESLVRTPLRVWMFVPCLRCR
jgi:hypothetical protein